MGREHGTGARADGSGELGAPAKAGALCFFDVDKKNVGITISCMSNGRVSSAFFFFFFGTQRGVAVSLLK